MTAKAQTICQRGRRDGASGVTSGLLRDATGAPARAPSRPGALPGCQGGKDFQGPVDLRIGVVVQDSDAEGAVFEVEGVHDGGCVEVTGGNGDAVAGEGSGEGGGRGRAG